LRVNFNHNNFYYIPELLETFPEDIRPVLRVIYEPIFGERCLSATENIKSEEISSKMTEYYRLAMEMGYDVILGRMGTGKLVYCYAERENQVIINYNGDIYKCSVCGFKPEERVGFLNMGGKIVYEEERLNKWVGANLFEEGCYSCKFLPLCMGGCRKTRLEHANTGSYCSLVPTNASYILKAVAFENFGEILRTEYVQDTINVSLVK
jgi:radical SAM protein with 4Fe4S-binding SPASM domain